MGPPRPMGPMPRGGRGMFQRGGWGARGFQPRGGPPMRGGHMGPPRGMPFGMNRGRGQVQGMGMGMGGNRRGFANRGAQPQFRGGRGGQGGPKFGGGGGNSPWGNPNPWQQQQQPQRPQNQGYGNMWNQGNGHTGG